jgi:hypothetical protein
MQLTLNINGFRTQIEEAAIAASAIKAYLGMQKRIAKKAA